MYDRWLSSKSKSLKEKRTGVQNSFVDCVQSVHALCKLVADKALNKSKIGFKCTSQTKVQTPFLSIIYSVKLVT
jgi:hypothetical protein